MPSLRLPSFGPSPHRRFSAKAFSCSQGEQLRPFLVEQYPGWTTPGVQSLSSSECEPLSLRQLLTLADDRSLEQWESLSLGYPAFNAGSLFLREEIAARYSSGELGPAQVNVLAPQEGIYLAMRALLSPAAHVVVTSPCYQSLYEVARAMGCELSHWRPRGLEDGGTPRFDPDDLAALLRPSTRLVVANWPHNPTGALPSEAEAAQVVQQCEAAGAHLLVDEMYRGLEHGERAPLPAACDAYVRGISLSGVSKAHGLPGLRIGWLASRDQVFLGAVSRLKDYTTICPAAPSELLAAIALRSQVAILAANKRRIASGKAALRSLVARRAQHLEWAEPQAGTFAFLRLAEGSANAYCDALRARAALMLVPSPCFEFGDERVRVTFGNDSVLDRLRRWEDDLAVYGLSCQE